MVRNSFYDNIMTIPSPFMRKIFVTSVISTLHSSFNFMNSTIWYFVAFVYKSCYSKYNRFQYFSFRLSLSLSSSSHCSTTTDTLMITNLFYPIWQVLQSWTLFSSCHVLDKGNLYLENICNFLYYITLNGSKWITNLNDSQRTNK